MDGREPDMVLTRYIFYSNWRNGRAHCRRLNARSRWHQPAQAKLNQQHQHKVLASIRRQLWPAGWYSVSVFRGRRLDFDVAPAALRVGAWLAGSTPKRHRPHSASGSALNF